MEGYREGESKRDREGEEKEIERERRGGGKAGEGSTHPVPILFLPLNKFQSLLGQISTRIDGDTRDCHYTVT